jgi:hypothetical protein
MATIDITGKVGQLTKTLIWLKVQRVQNPSIACQHPARTTNRASPASNTRAEPKNKCCSG